MSTTSIIVTKTESEYHTMGDEDLMEDSVESVFVPSWPRPERYPSPELGRGNFVDWFRPFYTFIAALVLEIAYCAFYSLVLSMAIFFYPSGSSLNTLIRAFVIGLTKRWIFLAHGETTGATLDAPELLSVGFSEMFFGRKFRKDETSAGSRISVIGKIILLAMAQFLGYLIGVSALSTVTGNAIVTTDCLVTYADSCAIQPVFLGVSGSEGRWKEFYWFLLAVGSYFVAFSRSNITIFVKMLTKTYNQPSQVRSTVGPQWTPVEDPNLASDTNLMMGPYDRGIPAPPTGTYPRNTGEPVIPPGMQPVEIGEIPHPVNVEAPLRINDQWYTAADLIGGAEAIGHVFFSPTNGVGGNFWFWLVTSAYVRDFTGGVDKAWEGFCAGLVAWTFQLLYFALAVGAYNYTRSGIQMYKKFN